MKKLFVNRFVAVGLLVMIMGCASSCKAQHRGEANEAEVELSAETVPDKTMQLYENLMASFSDDWEEVEPAPEAYPAYYGGVFISNDGQLVVMMTEDNEANRADINARIGSSNFETEVCEYSYREMMEVMNRIDSFLSNPDIDAKHPVIDNFSGSLADVLENRVVVHLRDVSPNVLSAFIRDVSDADCIVFKEGGMFGNND